MAKPIDLGVIGVDLHTEQHVYRAGDYTWTLEATKLVREADAIRMAEALPAERRSVAARLAGAEAKLAEAEARCKAATSPGEAADAAEKAAEVWRTVQTLRGRLAAVDEQIAHYRKASR